MNYNEKYKEEYIHFNKMDYTAQMELIRKNVSIRFVIANEGYLKPKIVIEELTCAIPNLLISRKDVIDCLSHYCEETQ